MPTAKKTRLAAIVVVAVIIAGALWFGIRHVARTKAVEITMAAYAKALTEHNAKAVAEFTCPGSPRASYQLNDVKLAQLDSDSWHGNTGTARFSVTLTLAENLPPTSGSTAPAKRARDVSVTMDTTVKRASKGWCVVTWNGALPAF